MPAVLGETFHTGSIRVSMTPTDPIISRTPRLTQLAKPRKVCENPAPLEVVLANCGIDELKST